ncbi:phosphonate metabolism protein [Phaeobacter gallaeciensis]|uniref:Phosphonate metabolism protein n=2 Tax=Roseobacteraceae TaxID=2854170 RepID=A0A366WQE0_9RHOB|nr:DUF1045 domain-containing protein [Phaeobacter gallaeciensis]MBT3141664.1 DUF1045 domain-containing protein [Falsiruegeria litorea]MBT8170159.1 DUF1045 domain-containing protein [Falsiruegeria litorea]RBW50779.1 phosphonate metabolism protein [Phaeobacter gallaeciensis]
MTFTRYALYFAPPTGADWTKFGASWLGWDMETGTQVAHPLLDDLPVAEITDTPRKYGLHGTMKPPFRLAKGQTVEDLKQGCSDLAASTAPVHLQGLELAQLGKFLALRPIGEIALLSDLAAECVRALDRFRAPAPQAELEKRRAKGLSPAQEANLVQWGYPYVMENFKFHITLTSRLEKSLLPHVLTTLDTYLTPVLPIPFEVNDLALMGEDAEGRFHLIQRYPLTGSS